MATGNHAANLSLPTDNFSEIWETAKVKYEKDTGVHLEDHPFAQQLDKCQGRPKEISALFARETEALDKLSDNRMTTWCQNIADVLLTCSAMLNNGIGPIYPPGQMVLSGFGILLQVMKAITSKQDIRTLVCIFGRISYFLERLNHYIQGSLTVALTTLLGNIMGEILSVLALSTKLIKERRIKKVLKRLRGKFDVEDALLRLDGLAKEEKALVAAKAFEDAHHTREDVKSVMEIAGDIKGLLVRDVWRDTQDIRQCVSEIIERLDRPQPPAESTKSSEAAPRGDGKNEEIKGILQRIEKKLFSVDETVKAAKEGTDKLQRLPLARAIKVVPHSPDPNAKEAKERMDERERTQMLKDLQTWLTPPDPSINHRNARETWHNETSTWFTQHNTFRDWKNKGSLLWIRGNTGSGKSILCSAIIEGIKKNSTKERSALVAYYYFDIKDASKRHLRGLLASVLFQLSSNSGRCRDVLHQLYKTCREGSARPSDADLANCLKSIVGLPEQHQIFIIIDALDECPGTTETPSAREEVLGFVTDLVGSKYSNLFVCVTSRPEQDIQTTLDPLTPRRVSLQDENGQRDDIKCYVNSVVDKMKRWRKEDKELVINTLTERVSATFLWVSCQLETLRRCFPSSIRKTLNELPASLDETYARELEGIPKQKHQHVHRLLQCLVAALRPLRVEELTEIFAIEFDLDAEPNLLEDWRPEDQEEAILSACPTLVNIVGNDKGPKIVQLSHLSVRDFLTSGRLRTSGVGNIRHHYVPLDAAHTTLTQACIAVLLELGKNACKERLAKLPLAFYAAQYWFRHVNYEKVASRFQHATKQLFDLGQPYLATWLWMYDVDQDRVRGSIDTLADHPSPPEATRLYYAVSCGLVEPAKYLISDGEDVHAKCGVRGSPLHAASYKGHLDVVSLLVGHGADLNMANESDKTPLCEAYDGGHLKVMRLLLDRGASPDTRYDMFGLLTHQASIRGQAEVIGLLIEKKAHVNATAYFNFTPLHYASSVGHVDVVKVLLAGGANVNAMSSFGTPLYRAANKGYLEIARLLLDRGAKVDARLPSGLTPYQVAKLEGHTQVAQLLDPGVKKDGAKNEPGSSK